MYKRVDVWTELKKRQLQKSVRNSSSSSITDHVNWLPRRSPCCPEPEAEAKVWITPAPSSQPRIPWDHSQKPVTKSGSQRAAKERLQYEY
jgi:hypothetical protein